MYVDRGAKDDLQFIFARLQEWLHIPGPAAEHVIGLAKQFSVQGDFGQRVQPVTDQGNVFFIGQGFVHVEDAPVFPIAFGHPLDFLFIVCHEWVRDASQGEQIGMHAARDDCREPFLASRIDGTARYHSRFVYTYVILIMNLASSQSAGRMVVLASIDSIIDTILAGTFHRIHCIIGYFYNIIH